MTPDIDSAMKKKTNYFCHSSSGGILWFTYLGILKNGAALNSFKIAQAWLSPDFPFFTTGKDKANKNEFVLLPHGGVADNGNDNHVHDDQYKAGVGRQHSDAQTGATLSDTAARSESFKWINSRLIPNRED